MSNWSGKVSDAVRVGDGSSAAARITFTNSQTSETLQITMQMNMYKNGRDAWIAAKIANLDQCDADMAQIRADIAPAG